LVSGIFGKEVRFLYLMGERILRNPVFAVLLPVLRTGVDVWNLINRMRDCTGDFFIYCRIGAG